MSRGKDGRGIVEEDVYGFWVDRGGDVVVSAHYLSLLRPGEGLANIQDLWYWTFYPFNFGKPVGPFGVLGNRMSDAQCEGEGKN